MYKRDVAVVILSFLALFLCLQHEGSFSFRKAWCVCCNRHPKKQFQPQAASPGVHTLVVALLCRYHATLHDPSKLEVLQDRLEDLPPPVVVRAQHAKRGQQAAATRTCHSSRTHASRPQKQGISYSSVFFLQADLNGDGHLEVIIATHDYQLQVGVLVCVSDQQQQQQQLQKAQHSQHLHWAALHRTARQQQASHGRLSHNLCMCTDFHTICVCSVLCSWCGQRQLGAQARGLRQCRWCAASA